MYKHGSVLAGSNKVTQWTVMWKSWNVLVSVFKQSDWNW